MKRFLGSVVIMLMALGTAVAQQAFHPTTPHFAILDASTGGFCYLTAMPTFAPNLVPTQIKIHGITIGQASGFGNLRIDHFQTVNFDQTGKGTIQGATMVLSFTDGVIPPNAPDMLTLSYEGTGAPLNAFGQGAMNGTFTVVSGTGRFAGMNGLGVWAGAVALQPPPPAFWSPPDSPPDFRMLVADAQGVLTADAVPPPATPACAVQGHFVGFLTKQKH
jgi:hypothetical protein